MNNNYQLIQRNSAENLSSNYIVFCLKNKHYAILLKDVIEVINIPYIGIPQAAPDCIAGIINYKGLMIKVIDICPLLGFTTDEFNINNQLIIICINGNCYALHTNNIINIINIYDSQLHPLPFNTNNSILTKIYNTDSDIINILDINILDNILSQNTESKSGINYFELLPKDEKSQKILKMREEQNQQKHDIFSFDINLNSIHQFVLFTIDNNNYFLDLKYIKEFTSIKRLNITKLPYTPEFIKGIINLKGEFLTVLDLKKFLNPDDNSKNSGNKLIIIESKNYNLAILVDEIKYIKNLNNINSRLYINEHSNYIYSEFTEDDKLYSIINIEKIINDEKLYINID